MKKKSDAQILGERIAQREEEALNRIKESLAKIFIYISESEFKEKK